MRRDRVRIPDVGEVERDVVLHPGAVVIVPVTGRGTLLLVRQYRYAAGESLLEFPAGTREAGEEPDATAGRELQEEVGFRPGRLTRLGEFYSAPGFCDERLICYLGEELEAASLDGDDDEQIEVVELTWEAVFEEAAAGHIRDAKTLAALFLAAPGRRSL
ncbi:MAG TPA: NUDIX hydrolase [Gemmatimonadota bacterium]|nr:NUDIX hydrolase [Gemmatimonadota bacterium]